MGGYYVVLRVGVGTGGLGEEEEKRKGREREQLSGVSSTVMAYGSLSYLPHVLAGTSYI